MLFGFSIGIAIALTTNIGTIQREINTEALPTRILDRNNKLITTLFSEENRQLVQFNELPRVLLQALITREDKDFFYHNGFSVRGTTRAALNLLLNKYISGGSTLSQQVAGVIYADRREFSLKRKIEELWWSFQIEKSWSKQEILEEYLNKMYFGHGNYGVETSSQFFFGHSAKTLNSAESTMLVIQLASPNNYSPLRNPTFAQDRQEEILQQMVELKFISQKKATQDFQLYWENFDFTREGFTSAFLKRDDKAPYFTEYVRNILTGELNFSGEEINTQGYTIYTTLDLDIQKSARKYFDKGLEKANIRYKNNEKNAKGKVGSAIPVAALTMLLFNEDDVFFSQNSLRIQEAKKYFLKEVAPIVALSNVFFQPSPNTLTAQIVGKAHAQSTEIHQEETVEGALITIDNRDASIVAMIGGSKFDATNQFNRAVDSAVQPGSAFKPLYYSAGIETEVITPSTIIWDSPVIFYDEDGNSYTPFNYKGEWTGPVRVRNALAHSMNVPSLKVLDAIGFPKVLEITSQLLDIKQENREALGLVPKYPIGLGVVSVSPLAMTKAYGTIANQGRKINPIAIKSIKDRNGKTIYQPNLLKNSFSKKQIISKQTAYIMSSLLQTTTERGTLSYARYQAHGFTQPTAGKTGTTQNWSDAWTLGFTPYYTTALWFGFDKGGQSLGTNQTGAVTTGPVWAKYMEEINKNLPRKEFEKPSGIVTMLINPRNNTKAVQSSEEKINEIYIVGTEPKVYDNPKERAYEDEILVEKLENPSWTIQLSNNEVNRKRNQSTSSSLNLRLTVPSQSTLKKLPSDTNSNTQSKEDTTNPLLD